MRRQDKPRREPKRQGLEALAELTGEQITCLRCNKPSPLASSEPFKKWGHVCAACAKHLRALDARVESTHDREHDR